ncbi:MAG: aminotransferase class I/II-fold pyridoxal phosphate-dependent enzyme [Gammaproteobacteria bacterium]|nr:aminotransferase class I/II-fold pyridoxal phosphate-dependent enzyme [Gammaproteobacteria bacterium]
MIKDSLADLAIFGGTPAFAEPVHVGQLNLPPWNEFEQAFNGIFDRRYFTNHGPLVQELDRRLAGYLGVRHVVCVTNATVALMVACKALDLDGEVIVPSFTFPATVQALFWAGLTPVFCDVDPATHNISAELAAPLVGARAAAILGVHAWGRAGDTAALQDLCARRGIHLFYDAAHGVGCTHDGRSLAAFGELAVFSFHATKILGSGEGGCLATDNDDLAQRIRTVRNFHVSESVARVPLRINGKMTEAQAAMGLLGLDHLPRWIQRNRELYERYRTWDSCRSLGGFVDYARGGQSNCQFCVFDIDSARFAMSRDQLQRLLRSENILARRYFFPGVHRLAPYCTLDPEAGARLRSTEALCGRLLQLPLGTGVTADCVDRITGVLDLCLRHGADIARRLPQEQA